jgi:uncharacterized Zn finger protein
MTEKVFRVVGPLKSIEPPKPPSRELRCLKCGTVTTWEAVVDPDAPERTVAHRCTECGAFWRHDKDRPTYWDGAKMRRRPGR